MSSGLEKLRSIGAQKIHEQTHIARQHAQALLHESFDDMSRIHFLGFISILEREYSVDLSDLKAKAVKSLPLSLRPWESPTGKPRTLSRNLRKAERSLAWCFF